MNGDALEKNLVNPLILNQSFEFVIMLFAGMTVMMFYQLFQAARQKCKTGSWIAFVQDLLFWLFAALLTASFLYYCSYGRLSVHAFAAFGTGVVLWKTFFCGKII